MDRPLLAAFGFSLACHLALLGFQAIRLDWLTRATHRKTLEVIYEYRATQQEVQRLQSQLAKFDKHQPSSSGLSAVPGMTTPTSQIRIPDRAGASPSTFPSNTPTGREAVVDLTNLVEAAQGNPVLLSYFSAIREQIQRTANRRSWLADESTQGLVYVSFVLTTTGHVQSVTVLSDRSIPSPALHDIALRIIKASSPFPPFPPSLADSSKTLIVPLEFLVSS